MSNRKKIDKFLKDPSVGGKGGRSNDKVFGVGEKAAREGLAKWEKEAKQIIASTAAMHSLFKKLKQEKLKKKKRTKKLKTQQIGSSMKYGGTVKKNRSYNFIN